MAKSTVYFTKEITPEAVLKMYRQLGVELPGKVAVKVHSGEDGNQNFLRPEFMKPVIDAVHGTVVECNTAYGGARNETPKHVQLMKKHGWSDLFDVDIMDAEGPDVVWPVKNGKVLSENLLGKDIVQKGLDMGIFYRREDGSVWIDLTADGLDQKLLLRGDGTSVYMTQDLGTAYRRFEENDLDDMIYVVGNEQNYHFQVLKLVLKKLGYDWSDHITHLSYGMVELPNGKMKSREGTVVDADDLIDDMVRTAREMSDELGKLDDCTEDEAAAISRMVGLGALKYFILKVDPKKTMLFDPRESIDFNGNTGPFIQYTHARIRSVLRKAQEAGIACGEASAAAYLPEEVALVKQLADYPNVVKAAAENFAPSIVAAYAYELAKQYNAYYHDHSILREEDAAVRAMRLRLSEQVARVIRLAMRLLGIDVPERM